MFKNLESQELTSFHEFASLSSIDQLSFEMFSKVNLSLPVYTQYAQLYYYLRVLIFTSA